MAVYQDYWCTSYVYTSDLATKGVIVTFADDTTLLAVGKTEEAEKIYYVVNNATK